MHLRPCSRGKGGRQVKGPRGVFQNVVIFDFLVRNQHLSRFLGESAHSACSLSTARCAESRTWRRRGLDILYRAQSRKNTNVRGRFSTREPVVSPQFS